MNDRKRAWYLLPRSRRPFFGPVPSGVESFGSRDEAVKASQSRSTVGPDVAGDDLPSEPAKLGQSQGGVTEPPGDGDAGQGDKPKRSSKG